MAIQEIKEIPVSSMKKNQKQQIKDDIKYAIENGISRFEFVGNDYNYKYLAQYAKEVIDRMMIIKMRAWAIDYENEALTEEERNIKGFFVSRQPYWDFKRFCQPIKVFSVKGEGKQRVFCEIDFSDFDRHMKMMMDEQIQKARKSHEIVDGKWVYISRKERKC